MKKVSYIPCEAASTPFNSMNRMNRNVSNRKCNHPGAKAPPILRLKKGIPVESGEYAP